MIKTTIYLRVSTDKQDEASQSQTIATWLESHPAEGICNTITDTASGGTPWQKRGIATALEQSERGDTIIVAEISRIARSTVGVLTFLQAAAEKGVTVHAIRSGITLDQSMSSKIVVTMLALAAEIERDLLRERTAAALQARKAAGKPIGRQVGAKGKKNKLDGRMAEIQPLLDAGVSKAAIARILKVSRQTLHTYLSEMESQQF